MAQVVFKVFLEKILIDDNTSKKKFTQWWWLSFDIIYLDTQSLVSIEKHCIYASDVMAALN